MTILIKHFIASMALVASTIAPHAIAAEPDKPAPQPAPRSRGDKIDQLAFARLQAKDMVSAAYTFKAVYEEAAMAVRSGVIDLDMCQKDFKGELRELADLRTSFVKNLDTQEKLDGLKAHEKEQSLAGFDSVVQDVVENIRVVQRRCPKLDFGT